jgi:hypothetical protein
VRLCVVLVPQVQHDEMERQRMHMFHQQLAAGSMVSTEPTASTALTYQPPSVGMMAGAGVTPMALSRPSAMECTTLAGAVGQSAQSLLQHSLSGSLSSHAAAASTAVFGPSSCPELPQVCAAVALTSAVACLISCAPGAHGLQDGSSCSMFTAWFSSSFETWNIAVASLC